ncbi:putative SAC3/GANP family protein [Lyophyllum shimeji]|uniref:SAC3/GANP family protein n=1 Tax=Lyophyllum shimeji TaxID=47721 RepID=A0A9P3PWI2_LYOSH|nr:putative SAC3/GANP family protein [Lyophyllum shimeji]
MDEAVETEEEEEAEVVEQEEEPILETQEEREKFYQSLVKARELERKQAIAEGKMDDPSIPKRLEDAICVVGTCMDMCPRFERYRRERENNLFEWETIPGTKRVDHKRAVKMYERAAGDKTLPSDLRPPHVLKRTLDYLFHDLLPRGGFSATFSFIRDRSRAVRNDFTMQHSYGPEAIECHDRCARFHILALHFERDRSGFSIALEEQQLMNTLQSLKEFYEDQRGRYQSPTELEMRVYHRLIHIRDQRERHEDIPEFITSHPVFKLTTDFRLHVQRKSAPISKTSKLVVDAEAMQIFGNLATVLREQGNVVMIYLVACILERLFGKDAIEDIEAIRGDLSIPNIIDGVSPSIEEYDGHADDEMYDELTEDARQESTELEASAPEPDATEVPSSSFGGPSVAAPQAPPPVATSAFSTISTTPNVFKIPSPFEVSAFPSTSSSSTSAFGASAKSVFGMPATAASRTSASPTAAPSNVFGTLSFPSATSASNAAPTTSSTTGPLATNTLSFSTQPNPFNLSATSSTSAKTDTLPARANTDIGEATLFGKTSIPQANGFPSNGLPVPSLNPTAVPFVPKNTSLSSVALSGQLPQKTPTSPALAPLLPETNAPPSPAALPLSASASVDIPPSISARKMNPPPSEQTSTTPPVLPKINTNTSFSSFQNGAATPTVPPPAPKPGTISLPPTPSLNAPPKTLHNFLKGSLATPTAGPSQEILSPIYFSSPTTQGRSSIPEFSLDASISSRTTVEPSVSLPNGKGKAPAKAPIDEEELENKAADFVRKSTLVKTTFRCWQARAIERAAWIEACEQSEAYKEKIKHQRKSLSLHPDKKRRISAGPGTVVDSVVKKRARRRVSSDYHPPRTDEELARRLKEVHTVPFNSLCLVYVYHYPTLNHEEHERRWAQGSFLNVVTNHVKSKLNGSVPHASWHIWLSMNPESDATAIWLERKFDVPASGDWVSEAVFSIPLTRTKDPTLSKSPGIVVFECTPLAEVTDELERKYRILDDCARLRDLVNAFPPRRHFVPSLLVVSWTRDGQDTGASDFVDMVNKLVESHTIEDYHTFSITSATKDLDEKLGEALNILSLDLEGKLVRPLTIRGTFKLFEPSVMSFISEWLENCSINEFVDWHFFGQIVQAALALMDMTVRSVSGLLSGETYDIFPAFDSGDVVDNDSAYDRIMNWLSAVGGRVANIALNLQTHRDIGQDFPAREFFEQLWDFIQSQVEIRLKRDPRTKFYTPVADITTALEAQEKAYEPHRAQLVKALHMSIRRSPKRRSVSVDTDLLSAPSKRIRLASPDESLVEPTPVATPSVNGHPTPSPTPTNISLALSEGPPVVTVAMLRALTRDMKKKYAASAS